MAAPTLTEIMEGIDSRLAEIGGLRGHSAFLADQVTPPHTVVQVPNIEDYRETMGRGTVLFTVSVFLFIAAQLDRVGQRKLAEFVSWTGANSIPLALEATGITITGVDQVVCDSFRNFGIEEVGVIGYYGGEFTCRIVARGT